MKSKLFSLSSHDLKPEKVSSGQACKEDLAVTIILPTPNFPLCHWPTHVSVLGPHLSLGVVVPL